MTDRKVADAASASLFRAEAVEHHRQRLYGEVVMTSPLTHWAVTGVIAAAIFLLLLLLVFGSYARKETIGGWIRPDRGVIQVSTQDEGTVETLAVSEGEDVAAGAPLLTLRLDADMSQGQALSTRLMADIDAERAQLEQQRAAVDAQFTARESRQRSELAGLEEEVIQFRRQLAVHDQRLALARKQLEERSPLVTQGFVSPLDQLRLEDALLAVRQAKEDLQQDVLVKQNRINSLRHELLVLPHDRLAALGSVGEKLAVLNQRQTEVGRRAHVTLTAPVAGRVASLRVDKGETAKAKSALVDILPSGARLQAELYAPTRATGFLQPGSAVQLRYDAFPYQKYGVSMGRVVRVSRTTVDPRDLPRGLAGDEPVYRVVVALDRDELIIDGGRRPLQAGMTLKADLILERRRVAEYVFAPLVGFAKRQ